MTGGWAVGCGSRDITPAVGSEMSGFVIRREPARGIHDRLHARALAIADTTTSCCILILDLIAVDMALSRSIRRSVAAATGLDVDGVVVAATHTHGGPPILPNAYLGTPDASYRERVTRQATAAAVAAVQDLAPARLHFAVHQERTVARNRRLPIGPGDYDVPVLRIDRGGALSALLVSYACHPVTLGPDNLLITRDFPGALLDALAERHGAVATVYATGCAGQINTGHTAHDSMRAGAGTMRTFAEAERIGSALAATAERALEDAVTQPPLRGPLAVARRRFHLPLMPPPASTPADLRAWEEERSTIDDAGSARAAVLDALVSWATHVAPHPTPSVEVEAACIGLGDLALVFYPGEVFVEYGIELKQAFPDVRLMTIAYAHCAPGYVPHGSAIEAGGYEVAEAYRYYGYPGPLRADAGDVLQGNVRRLVREVTAGRTG